MEVKRYYFAGHAFPEPISGYGKQDGYVAYADHAALAALAGRMAEALREAKSHCAELADAWHRGALSEHDAKGGTRSNRNSDILVQARALLAEWNQRGKEPEANQRVNDLLGEVLHLWVDGYISKSPKSSAPDEASQTTFENIRRYLEGVGIRVDYCGAYRVDNSRPQHATAAQDGAGEEKR